MDAVRLRPNKSLQPTSVSSLRSSPAAAELNRYASLLFLSLCLLICVSTMASADEEAYVIVRAIRSPADAGQPQWISAITRTRDVHIPANALVFKMLPGRYNLNHIDFEKNRQINGGKTLYLSDVQIRFEVRAGYVTYLGTFQIETDGSKETIRVLPDPELISLACNKYSEILSRLPMLAWQRANDKAMSTFNCATHNKSLQPTSSSSLRSSSAAAELNRWASEYA